MTLAELQKETYKTACDKGWYENPPSALENHMLIVSEVAEATEAVRENQPKEHIVNGKPEGEKIELADAVIRIMNYFEHNGWSLTDAILLKEAYNKTRPYRHGNKSI